ncbi:MAG: UDP-3-O-(3-hydroxymyristoyl)glucosamine N-acyltransferase [Candidatus Omnitrophota bacterium]
MITLEKIADILNAEIIGDKETKITGMANVDSAGQGDLIFAVDERSLTLAGQSQASCVVSKVVPEGYPKTILRVNDMKTAAVLLFDLMEEIRVFPETTIHPSAIVDASVEMGKNVCIGPNVVIGKNTTFGNNISIYANCVIGENVTIGDKSCLYPNVTIYDRCKLGEKVIIHSGTVIGSDGFGYVLQNGKIHKVPQLGTVIIEDNVEIGSNSSVDRGTFECTRIQENVKIDNLVQIAHNVQIGKNVMIAAESGIGGSVVIGENTMIGGTVGVADHVSIGKNARIGGKTGVHGNVKENATMFGYPAREAHDAKKLHGLLSLLLKRSKKFRELLRDDVKTKDKE